MVSPIVPNIVAASPDHAAASVRGEVSAPAPLQGANHTAAPPATQDKVNISPAAISISKVLQKDKDHQPPAVQEESVRQKELAVKEPRPVAVLAKQYPPFMGNDSAFKALRLTSPAMYREIIRMTTPITSNLPFTDTRMPVTTKGAGVTSTNNKSYF